MTRRTSTCRSAAGLRCRCPRCGKGKLFQGFLTLRPRCDACGLDYAFVDAGDGPAVFVILIAGVIVVVAALIIEVIYQPPFWLHAVLWLPLILLVTLAPLRPMKGLLIALQYHHKAARRPARTSGRRVMRARRRGGGMFCATLFALVGIRHAGRARHLAARAQGLEGRSDRHAERRGSARAAGAVAAARRMAAADRRGERIPPRRVSGRVPRRRRRRWSTPPARRLRRDVTGPGYWVFAPARLAGGSIVVVNRGFVPDDRKDPATRAQGAAGRHRRHHRRHALAGDARHVHAGRRREGQSLVRARSRRRWPRRRAGTTVAPFYIDLEAPVPPGGLPKPGSSRSSCRTTICNTRSPGSASR